MMIQIRNIWTPFQIRISERLCGVLAFYPRPCSVVGGHQRFFAFQLIGEKTWNLVSLRTETV